MFDSIRVYFNDVLVTKNPTYYPYKAYITNCLTYSASYKACQLSTEGYFQDFPGHMGPADVNSGFVERNLLFRVGNKAGAAYNPNGVRFFGRLHLDFISCTTGLPPGTKVKIELDRSSDDFVLMKKADDTENYKVELLSCYVFVPVAQLSAPLFTEIGSLFSHESINIHFRRNEVRIITLTKDKEEYSSDMLFSGEIPCRVILCFVRSEDKTGKQTTNPFDFQRTWPQKKLGYGEVRSERENILEAKLNSIHAKLDKFQAIFDLDDEMLRQINEFSSSRKSSGKGKRSQSLQEQSSVFSRLRNAFQSQEQSDSPSPSTSSSRQRTPPPEYQTIAAVQDDPLMYVKEIELSLNGIPIDQLDIKESLEDCIITYWRMFQMSGFARTLFTNGITYDAFR